MSDNRAKESSTNSGAETGAGDTGTNSGGGIAGVRQSAADAFEGTREKTAAAYQSARERAGSAYQAVGQTARAASERTAAGIESNPMAALVGGLALGLVAGVVLPKTKREQALLGGLGGKIHDTAREAARAAKDAGREQIEELGLSRDAVQRRIGDFTDRAVGAVKTSAGAAAGKVGSDA